MLKRTGIKIGSAAFIVILMISFGLPVAYGFDNFGAISYSSVTGAYGLSYDYRSRNAAERRAIRECEGYAGSGDCRILVWFRNACGALAQGDGGVGTGWGANVSIAQQYALQSCRRYYRNCRVVKWVCTTR
jgi:serine/threonine-protein kinase